MELPADFLSLGRGSVSSDVQAIVVSDSPEMGFHGQLASETAISVDLGEVSPIHVEV